MLIRFFFFLLLVSFLTCCPSGAQIRVPDTNPTPVESLGLAAQDDPWSSGVVGTGLLLRRLDGVKRVLMIGAHPDDEDTSLLAALSRGMGVETAYLSLSRGEGGQNLIGPEMDEGLGIVRTGELLAARALDGGRQFFTRAFDFGYSKTAEETFRYWPKDEILRDVTWVVRTFRPQVIVSVFSGTEQDGHGQHQVSGIVAHEVFDAAGDPTRYPEQLAEGATLWSPSKLYRLTRRNPSQGTAGIETGVFDPLLGRSHFQVAMDSRSQHRSQDMGVAQPMGPRRSSVALVESRVQWGGPDEIFAGVDTALVSLAGDLPSGAGTEVVRYLEAYRAALAEAKSSLDVLDPWRAAEPLGRALGSLRSALEAVPAGEGDGDRSPSELERTLKERVHLIQEALFRAAGIVIDVRLDDELLTPGTTVEGAVELWNGGPFTLETVSGRIQAPRGWPTPETLATENSVAPGSLARWPFRLEIPEDAHASRAFYLEEPRDGEMYRWPDDPSLWASPANPDLLFGELTLDVGGLATIGVMRPARYRGVDKATGEFVKPIQVVPALSVALDPRVMAWPLEDRTAREFTVTLQGRAGGAKAGTVSLEVPDGWRVEPVSRPFSVSHGGGEASFTFDVTRPPGGAAGHFTVLAKVETDDGAEYSHQVRLVDYPHIRPGALFPEARSNVAVFPVQLDPTLRVGYVMGSGDGGAEALRQMGVSVELLGPEALRAGDLGSFDVIVLGIRAYETRPDLVSANERILEFADAGGTVIVQYNKYEYPGGEFAPYAVEMARPHDRVSDEDVPVRILDPAHALFRTPNAIGPDDFDGWVQERGLYFLRSWGPEFTPLLEMADPGEDPKRGGLLVSRVGRGVYVYTGLAFFRQFPEGVPGAYRLFANLLSLFVDDLEGRPPT